MSVQAMQASTCERPLSPPNARTRRRRAARKYSEGNHLAGRYVHQSPPRAREMLCEGESCGAEWDKSSHRFVGVRVYPAYAIVRARDRRTGDERRFDDTCWSEDVILPNRKWWAWFEANDGKRPEPSESAPPDPSPADIPPDLDADTSTSGVAIAEMEYRGTRLAEEDLPPEDDASLRMEIERYLAGSETPVELTVHFP